MEPTRLFTHAALGYVRVAVVAPELRVADVAFNTERTVAALVEAAAHGCQLAVFPELGLTSYSCADLFYHSVLLDAARAALVQVAEATAIHDMAAVVGLPLEVGGRLFNCAAFLASGRLVGIVPKTFLPNSNEFYEARWFTSAAQGTPATAVIDGEEFPFGADLIFPAANLPGCVIGIEVCEDLWAVNPPSGRLALAGATLLVNPSASNELLGKAEYRRDLMRQQSARCLAAYLLRRRRLRRIDHRRTVYAGHALIAENGALLVETRALPVRHPDGRRRRGRAAAGARAAAQQQFQPGGAGARATGQSASLCRGRKRWRRRRSSAPVSPPRPLSPATRRAARTTASEIFAIQATGLAKRLRHTGAGKVVIGVSGGLDSTLALLVIVEAFDRLGLNRTDIVAITMPGFGTTQRTRCNAERLSELLGVTLRVIPIAESVRQHFATSATTRGSTT
jgi:NAD+ synthase (glutamine-hydrolysing)